MVISKKDMGARAAKAAEMSPTIGDRLRQAGELVVSHPIDETSPLPGRAADASTASLSKTALASTDSVATAARGAALGQAATAVTTPAGAHLEMVPVDQIDQNPFNARKIYRAERVSELAASIGAHGQEIPGIATLRDGRYILVAGHYRLRALKVLGIKTMALMIREALSDRELYAHSYRENAEREGQSGLDNALSWRELLDQKIYTSETEIAETTGISLANVNKTLSALRLSPPVLDIVKEDPTSFPFTLLYDLVLFEGAAGQSRAIAMARQIGAGEVSRRDLQAARAQIETPKDRKRKETSRQYRIHVDGLQTGFIKEWDSGKVALEVQLTDPKQRQALLEELKRRFNLSDTPAATKG